jgi:hypothetical protein
MVTSAKRLRPEEDYGGESQQHIKRQTRPLAREGAPEKQDRNCKRVINIRSRANGARHQDLLIDCQSQCDFDFDLTWFSSVGVHSEGSSIVEYSAVKC